MKIQKQFVFMVRLNVSNQTTNIVLYLILLYRIDSIPQTYNKQTLKIFQFFFVKYQNDRHIAVTYLGYATIQTEYKCFVHCMVFLQPFYKYLDRKYLCLKISRKYN